MSDQNLACARCGTPISENDCFWEEDGRICQACMDKHELGQIYLKKVKGTAFGSMAASFICWFFNPFFIISIIAISGAIWTFRFFKTKDPLEMEVAAKNKGFMAPAIVAICVAGLNIIFNVVRLVFGLAALSFY